MNPQRIMVWDADPPNAIVAALMTALEADGSPGSELCVKTGTRDARVALVSFEPHVVVLLLRRFARSEARAVLDIPERVALRLPVIAVIAEGGPEDALALLKAGADDFVLPPVRPEEIFPRIWRLLAHPRRGVPVLHTRRLNGGSPLIGQSPAFLTEVERLPLIAGSDAGVLISGETGTGKELFARAVHDLSPRANRPFVPINCGAIPVDLAESEFFGHERGAFTGAHTASLGMIREAAGGTLFLDEVPSLSLHMQVKLLRFLQEKEVRPVGASSLHRVDVRVIAAAHPGLEHDVREGKFRRDLYYRLNTLPIRLPPLRERREDIPMLTRFFLSKFANHPGASFSDDAMEQLLRYNWPGNVRELEHVVERAVVMSGGRAVFVRDIDLPGLEDTLPNDFRSAKLRTISEFERAYIEGLLSVHRGNISGAARAAGKNRRSFWELIRKHGIVAERYRPRDGDD
ncbi:MAG TPA: sigma-54 dependent transcriptional regulator [Chthoniobacterales bacterium]